VEEAQEEAQEERKEIRHLHLESRLLAVVAAVAGQAQELLADPVAVAVGVVRLLLVMQEPLGKAVRVEMQKSTRITTAAAVEDSPLLEALHQQPWQALVALAWIALLSSHH
jgi:hypothetical protein